MSEFSTTIAIPFFVCKTCGVVDNNLDRMRVGAACTECGVRADCGRMFYSLSVKTLVKLMDEMHDLKPENHFDGPGPGVAVVLFYCTLVETLMENLLINMMRAQ